MLKLIVVGAGQVASSTHLPNLMNLRDMVEVAGIVDLQIERAQQLANQFHIPNYSDQMDDLTQRIKPDAAIVSVPNLYHAPTCINLLNRGVHVFCEKPPATNGADAKRMEDAARANQRLLTYDFHFRHSKDVATIRQKMDAGEFGQIYHINLEWLRRRGIPGWGSFTNKTVQGGGPLMDIGIHLLDLGLYFLNGLKPKVVLASQSDRIGKRGGHGFLGDWRGDQFTVEDALFGMIRFENDVSISLATSFALNTAEANERQVTLYGENLGADLFPLKFYREEQNRQMISQPLPEDDEELHLKCVRNFFQAILGNESLLVTPGEGTRVQQLVDALYQSAATGNAVEMKD